MKRILILLVVGILFCPLAAIAGDVSESTPVSTVDTIPISGLPADGEVLVDKANNMANSFYQLSTKLSIPLVTVIVLAGAILGIFIEAARKIALFSILALVIVYWAPMLVSMVVNWVQ